MASKRFASFLSVSLFLVYIAAFVFLDFYSQTGSIFSRREFTKKELSNGPLIMRDELTSGKENVIFSSVLLNSNLLFDQPISKDAIKAPETINHTLPVLSQTFISNFLEKSSELSQNKTTFFYFTLVNKAFERLTLNWLCNTAGFQSVHKRVLVVSLTKDVCERIQNEWNQVECLHLSADGYENSAEWGTQLYINMLTTRIQLMNKLAEASMSFVLFEPDSVWFRDPTEFFSNRTLLEDADIVVPIKGYTDKWDNLSFDPMLVHSTAGSRTLLAEMTARLLNDSTTYDQDVLNELCQHQFNGVICRVFDWKDIADGKWFKMSDRERSSYRPLVVNNNFYVGVENKESRQAMNGLWFLTKKNHCLSSKVKRAMTRYTQL